MYNQVDEIYSPKGTRIVINLYWTLLKGGLPIVGLLAALKVGGLVPLGWTWFLAPYGVFALPFVVWAVFSFLLTLGMADSSPGVSQVSGLTRGYGAVLSFATMAVPVLAFLRVSQVITFPWWSLLAGYGVVVLPAFLLLASWKIFPPEGAKET